MKIDSENSIRRLSFLSRLTGIKIAWINPCQGKIRFSSLGLGGVSAVIPKYQKNIFSSQKYAIFFLGWFF